MPVSDPDDARQVESHVRRAFDARSDADRAAALRRMLVETLDFHADYGEVSLAAAPSGVSLPESAYRIAWLDGVHALYAPLAAPSGANRVRKADASAAASLIADLIGDDLLLVFSNADASQLHFVHPRFTGARPTLRRVIIERDLPRRTAVQQISNIYRALERGEDVRAALDDAFDVEPVTKRFFAEYKRVFESAERAARGFAPNENEDRRMFVQTLFNRLMFVYFLSRKGWLSFGGDRDYLNALWRDYRARSDGGDENESGFHRDRLRPLFFGGLNNPRSEDPTDPARYPAARALIGDVPFLNGGLFEETDLDRRWDADVPDAVLESVLSDLFDKFNFTVMESTPFDVEVAVDPEMLGKVFEELVTGRRDSGAYYTPRAVVSFMCREALKGYLAGREIGAPPDAVAAFVDERDASGIPLSAARALGRALDEVAVVDPACGSGAYLLGMMQELVDLQTALYNAVADPRSLYDLKLHVISQSLYGADSDDFAVNIAMLRMWLSLAIEYEGDVPEPLPNLDFKIARGDSLLAPDPSAANYGDLFRHRARRAADRLADLKARHMSAVGHDKSALKEEVESVQRTLADALADSPAPAGATDWRVEFAEVFARGGFDITLANPPYVVIKDKPLRDMYKEGVYGRMNLYGLFIQRALQLVNDGGQIFFINPRTLLTDRYFTNLRKVIRLQAMLKGVTLIADRHNTFDRVLQECVILHLHRSAGPIGEYTVSARATNVPSDLNAPQNVVRIDSGRVLLGDQYGGSFYIGSSDFDYQAFERMDAVGARLSDFGLKAETGKIQFSNFRKYARSTGAGGAHRLVWAENTQRYAWRASDKRVGKEWLSNDILAAVPPNIRDAGVITQRTTANEQPRRIIASLINPRIAGSQFAYSENGTNFISIGDAAKASFILATLNSSVVEFIFRRLNSNVHVSAGEINQLPFPPMPDSKTLEEIESLVAEIMRLGGVDSPPDKIGQAIARERELDILIGSLYGFSPAEVERTQSLLPSYETVYGIA